MPDFNHNASKFTAEALRRNWKESNKFPKLSQSIFGMSEFWSEFRPSIALICPNALQNSLSPKWTEFWKFAL